MRIYTSSWFTRLPETIQKVGISRGTPRGYAAGYRKMLQLAPGPWFKTVDAREYRRRFNAQLSELNPRAVVDQLERIGEGRDVALLCYEAPDKPEDWCHRGMVSAWLHDTLGIEVHEYGYEAQGCGHNHPKLPAQFRGALERKPLDVTAYIGAQATDRDGRCWTVMGRDPENVDQARVSCGTDTRSISAETLRERFSPVG